LSSGFFPNMNELEMIFYLMYDEIVKNSKIRLEILLF